MGRRGRGEPAVRRVPVCVGERDVPLGDLEPWDRNPRRPLTAAEQTKLDESLRQLGLFRPLLVWYGADGRGAPTVIGGNMRLRRIKELVAAGAQLVRQGTDTPVAGVPITVYRGSEAQAKLAALRDNQSDGDWDWTALTAFTTDLARHLDELSDPNLNLTLSGFDEDFLQDLAAYGASDEARVMEAASAEIAADPDAGGPSDDDEGERRRRRELTDGDLQVVGVVIGHVRGRLTAATYRRLVAALSLEVDVKKAEGLDAAFRRVLDRLDVVATGEGTP